MLCFDPPIVLTPAAVLIVSCAQWQESVMQSENTPLESQQFSMIKCHHHINGWPLPWGFAPTPRFIWSQILYRLYKSPLDETMYRGSPCVYKCKKILQAR